MMDNHLVIVQATIEHSDEVAAVARCSRKQFLPYLPELHSFDEDRQFFKNVVFKENLVWLAKENGVTIGFCAFKENWVDHLYVLPSHVGRSVGQMLLDKAKATYPYLQVWVFQQNIRAISFYHRNGFIKVRETGGSECEERVPDALFEWRRR